MSPGGAREAATPARRRVLGLASVAAPMVVLDALVVSTALTAIRVHTPPDLTLAALRREFPGYRLWLESVRGRYRFMARRRNPGTGPHTVITSDLAELRAALTTPTQVTLDHGLLREAREARDRALELQFEADQSQVAYQHAIRRLHARGASLREIAGALGLSYQRVHQIVDVVSGKGAVRETHGDLVCNFCGRPSGRSAS